jgi:hypothetical protein
MRKRITGPAGGPGSALIRRAVSVCSWVNERNSTVSPTPACRRIRKPARDDPRTVDHAAEPLVLRGGERQEAPVLQHEVHLPQLGHLGHDRQAREAPDGRVARVAGGHLDVRTPAELVEPLERRRGAARPRDRGQHDCARERHQHRDDDDASALSSDRLPSDQGYAWHALIQAAGGGSRKEVSPPGGRVLASP